MDYKERFRNILKRLNSDSNKARYNAICTLTQNDDEQRVWTICSEFYLTQWGRAPLNFRNQHKIIATGLPAPLTYVMCPMGDIFIFWEKMIE